MQWRHRHQGLLQEQPDELLVHETQLFLNGNYLELAFIVEREITASSWLSTLAHGDEETVERASHWLDDNAGIRPELDTWGRVLEHLAREIIDTTQVVGCTLFELQRDLLVPLELAIITTPVGPATLYRLVNSMLAELKTRT